MDTITRHVASKSSTFDVLESAVDEARRWLEAAGGADRSLRAELEVEEIWASMRFADTPLERSEVDALVRRGIALGGHRLEAYIAVADYASAARYVHDVAPPNRRRGFLSVEEIVGLHARVTRRTSTRPGAFRASSLRPFPSGMIAPAAWLLPQTLAAYVDRLRAGPPAGTSRLRWDADAHEQYERIHPFEEANGRVGRLVVNLLLRRIGYPPFVVRPKDATRYLAALRAADARDPWPLARLLARSLARSFAQLTASLPEAGDLKPLSEFASGRDRATLYKAAQRGRLRAFRRAGRLFTTQAWIADYRAL